MPNFIKIGLTVAEIWRFNGFFKMAAIRHLGHLVPVWTTRDDHLMVCVVVPNMVTIDAVVSITLNFQYFARFS